ncbi:acyltransferase family protein [Leucobacter iarius]|uniref:Acyltransferase family protein n=1 Tax=Leucobacter iarius TaxID=333963 RepID=A0ABP4XLN6_9MICO
MSTPPAGTIEASQGRSPAGVRTAHRRDIQGLRALAVLLVMLDHGFGWPSGGYIGVDVFFVISGFVITGLLLREHDRTGSISLRNFYVRRIRRIAPASVLVIASTLLVGGFVLPHARAVSLWWDSLCAWVLAANWRMASTGTDYFQQSLPPSPLQHFWSLAVEEQFYLFWPLLMLLVFAVFRRRGRAALATAIALFIAAGLIWSWIQTANDPTFAYFSSFTRFWEIAAGALLACLNPKTVRIPNPLRGALLALGLGTILGTALLLPGGAAFPGVLAVLPVAGSALAILAGIGADPGYDRIAAPLTNRLAVHLGDISYSLYLWHFPVLILAAAVLPSSPLLTGVLLLVTWALAAATYALVENPIRFSDWLAPRGAKAAAPRQGPHRRTPVILAVALLTASATVLVSGGAFLSRAEAPPAASGAAAVAPGCLGAAALQSGKKCTPGPTFVPSVDGFTEDTQGAYSADCYRGQTVPHASCTFGSKDPSARNVALIGDSHAAMYIPLLRDLAPQLNWRITTYVGWGCPWTPHPGAPCEEQSELAQRAFTSDTPYDLILTASSRKALSKMTSIDDAKALWAAAGEKGTRILALESVPIPDSDSLICIQRVGFDPSTDRCGTKRSVAERFPDRIAQLAKSLPQYASLVPVSDLVCDPDTCSAVTGGVITYRDADGHLTASYTKTMAPYLLERLKLASAPASP